MNEGERVRWYLFGLGSEQDLHTAHWHGLRVVEDGRRRTDAVELLPASMKVADMVADNPGTWLFHCHVAEHMMEGMFARVVVHAQGSTGVSRAPELAFYGLRQAEQSLQVKRAEAVLDSAPVEVRLEGSVTVSQAFSVFTQPVRIQLGETAVSFKPDRRGTAATAGGSFRVTNAGQYGVVYGGLMEFEVTLRGAEWLAELKKHGLEGDSARKETVVSLTVEIGRARHTATTPIVLKSK
jgi:hypothetical protein